MNLQKYERHEQKGNVNHRLGLSLCLFETVPRCISHVVEGNTTIHE